MLGSRKKFKNTKITTLIGHDTALHGDIQFSGGLHVNGSISGNVISEKDQSSVLTLSEQGIIEGEVRVPRVLISGTVIGNVHAHNHIELLPSARITGSVYYTFIEMAVGAEVNGKLIHKSEGEDDRESLKSRHDPDSSGGNE
uniref:Protein CcmA, bactofilin family n=1 Tax=Candidatus Kentrum sp. TUN TaxID=2126343 RepID=A0A450ZLA9_9GAMM|nr:MAG: protein CcmA, bactofilin family [Candidatus Kentron sp. TUN]VFK57101.1 MAG: protein CcmA, bactofilin family [Candidatus Kentron sp. TUN]VFK57886.1 MAG: protein CcmA, bactofilin family [Candidatus Kentron sp. TUN]